MTELTILQKENKKIESNNDFLSKLSFSTTLLQKKSQTKRLTYIF